jgi:hypothetical protein
VDAFRREVSDVRETTRGIAQDLARRYPRGAFEVFLDKCGAPRPAGYKGTGQAVLRVFLVHCSEFPGAWVAYQPDHPYGIVAVVVGHCGQRKEECTRVCSNFRERPRTTLILREVAGREILLGGWKKSWE